jgi:hypothetical protein
MKFSYRQILASAAGAVLSAVVASIFGVKGTIVGVAIGSIAATTGTALVFQSIERTNKAMKQAVVRAPDSSKLLRRLGGTKAAGVTTSEPAPESALHEESATTAAQATGSVESDASDSTVGQPTAQITVPTDSAVPRSNLRWPVIVLAIAGVFVLSLVFVTVVELIAGRPLADLFGHSGGGTTVGKIFQPSPTTTLPPPTTSTTTSTSSTTTTSSSTTTTAVGNTTSSTDLGATTTTSPSAPGTSAPTTTSTTG